MWSLLLLTGASGWAGPQRGAAEEEGKSVPAYRTFPSQHISAQPKPVALPLQTSWFDAPLPGPLSFCNTPLFVLTVRLQLHKVSPPLRSRRFPPDPNDRGEDTDSANGSYLKPAVRLASRELQEGAQPVAHTHPCVCSHGPKQGTQTDPVGRRNTTSSPNSGAPQDAVRWKHAHAPSTRGTEQQSYQRQVTMFTYMHCLWRSWGSITRLFLLSSDAPCILLSLDESPFQIFTDLHSKVLYDSLVIHYWSCVLQLSLLCLILFPVVLSGSWHAMFVFFQIRICWCDFRFCIWLGFFLLHHLFLIIQVRWTPWTFLDVLTRKQSSLSPNAVKLPLLRSLTRMLSASSAPWRDPRH